MKRVHDYRCSVQIKLGLNQIENSLYLAFGYRKFAVAFAFSTLSTKYPVTDLTLAVVERSQLPMILKVWEHLIHPSSGHEQTCFTKKYPHSHRNCSACLTMVCDNYSTCRHWNTHQLHSRIVLFSPGDRADLTKPQCPVAKVASASWIAWWNQRNGHKVF